MSVRKMGLMGDGKWRLKNRRERFERPRHRPGSACPWEQTWHVREWPKPFVASIISHKIAYPKVWAFSISQLALDQAFSPLNPKNHRDQFCFWPGCFIWRQFCDCLVNICSKRISVGNNSFIKCNFSKVVNFTEILILLVPTCNTPNDPSRTWLYWTFAK